jgi:hypothetical protein
MWFHHSTQRMAVNSRTYAITGKHWNHLPCIGFLQSLTALLPNMPLFCAGSQ